MDEYKCNEKSWSFEYSVGSPVALPPQLWGCRHAATIKERNGRTAVLRLTAVVWNVRIDVVADEQLNHVVTVHFARVTESRSSGVVTSVDVRSTRKQQLNRRDPRLLLLHIRQTNHQLTVCGYPKFRSDSDVRTESEPSKKLTSVQTVFRQKLHAIRSSN